MTGRTATDSRRSSPAGYGEIDAIAAAAGAGRPARPARAEARRRLEALRRELAERGVVKLGDTR
jgi:hypothetical protein